MKSKKELKETYRQMKFRMGVFQIRNLANGKILVDSNTNLDAIWNRHRTQLKFNGHPNQALQSDWNTFGEDNFRFEILAELEEQEGDQPDYNKELKALAELYIEELQPFGDKGYNRPR